MTFEQALSRMAALCSCSEHCESEIREKLQKAPTEVVEKAVRGMLPKGPLGEKMYTKLHVYAGPDHKHQAQKPEVLEIKA